MLVVLFALIFITAHGLYSSPSAVKLIDSSEFDRIKNSKQMNLVEFYASWCGHCKAFAPEYTKVANAFSGIIGVLAIEDQSVLQREKIPGVPSVRLYTGAGKFIEYSGPRDAKSVTDFVLREISNVSKSRINGGTSGKRSSGEVIDLTETELDSILLADKKSVWFLEIYSPNCGYCKQLEPKWEEAAMKLKDKVKIARIDGTRYPNVSRRLDVQGFPTLKLFPSGVKSISTAVPFNGDREVEDIVNFAVEYSKETISVPQLTSQKQFESECESTVCVISMLPDLYDTTAEERKKLLGELTKTAQKLFTMPVKFMWTEGGANFDFEEALQLQFGYPAVVAVHRNKAKFSIHKGKFTVDDLRGFIISLVNGSVNLLPLPSNLPHLKTTQEWDGKDRIKQEL